MSRRDHTLLLLVIAWLAVTGGALGALSRYKGVPGLAAASPASWPGGALRPSRTSPTLLVFAHPGCVCTHATLAELARLMSKAQGALATYVVFQSAPSDDADDGSLRAVAQRIPGVRVLDDRDAVETTRFGAHTSGQALLYDVEGRLRFSGGITVARGHEGDSPGSDEILSLVRTGLGARAATPVFGCALAGATVSR